MFPIYEGHELLCPFYSIGATDLFVTDIGYDDFHVTKPFLTPRYQDGYTLHYVVGGRGYVHVGDVCTEVQANQLFVIRPDEYFYYHPAEEDPWDYVWFGFSGHLSEKLLSLLGFLAGVRSVDSTSPKRTIALLTDLFRQLSCGRVSEFEALAAFYRVIDIEKKKEPSMPTTASALTARAAELIRRNVENSEFRMTTLATMMHLCPSYLTRVFRREMGMSPINYLIEQRMSHAASLLAVTELAVGEISMRSGYRDVLHFSKCFRDFYGRSPREYRRHCRQGAGPSLALALEQEAARQKAEENGEASSEI